MFWLCSIKSLEDRAMQIRTKQGVVALRKRLFIALFLSASLTLFMMTSAFGEQQMKPASESLTLITETPDEGFALAVKLSQKGVATTQTDPEVRKKLRPAYANDPDSLIAVSHVIATHFQTIAAA